MGAGALTRALIAIAALAPAAFWWLPPASPMVAVLAVSLAIAAALHGLGRAIGSLIGDDDAPVALAIAWGLAGYLALGGWLSAAGVFDLQVQRIVLSAATAIGAVWCGGRELRAPRRPRLGLALVVPAVAIVAVLIHLLGYAGWWQGAFSDGEAHLLGPLGRLATSGELGDPFALPRTHGLGGNAVLHALAGGLGDWRMCHAIDRGLGLALFVALAFRGIGRGPVRALALFAIVAMVAGFAEYGADLAPRTTLIALLAALHQTLARRPSSAARDAVAPILLAAAAATLRHGALGALAVITVVAVLDTEREQRRRAVALAALVIAAVLGGYLLSAVMASAGEPAAPGVVAVLRPGAAGRLALCGVIAAIAYALAHVALRGHDDRALVVTIAATCAAIACAGPLAPARMVWLTVQPLSLALVLLMIAPLLASATDDLVASPRAAAAAVGLVLAFAILRQPTGRPALPWDHRVGKLMEGARKLAAGAPTPDEREAAAYRDVLAGVPRGTRVGLWVDRPDLVDYRGHAIFDLRTPATAACVKGIPRAFHKLARPGADCRRLALRLPRLELDYLIVSTAVAPRAGGTSRHLMCWLFNGRDCVDPLTRFVGVERRRAAAELDVIDLRAR